MEHFEDLNSVANQAVHNEVWQSHYGELSNVGNVAWSADVWGSLQRPQRVTDLISDTPSGFRALR